jgi:hypothetical protein
VIGSGPSLTGFDFNQLPAGYRFGANKSGWLADCHVLVTLDRNFPRKCAAELAAYRGEKVIAVGPEDARDDPTVTYVRRERADGFSDDPGALRGLDSGFAALNLAYLRGFKDIALLGFDFMWNEGRSHFHEGYVSQNKHTDRFLGNWAPAFHRVVPQLEAAGCRVTNFVGPRGSRVTAFPTRPLEDLI